MAQLVQYDAKYGTQTTFYFSLEDGADAQDLFTSDATNFAAGDVKISKDGGALANTTNLPTQITAAQPGYAIVLTATEMQAGKVLVTIRDQTATEVFEPATIIIDTRKALGQLDIDATQIGGNTTAFALQGVGSGKGIHATGGATGEGVRGTGGSSDGDGIMGIAGGTQGSGINGSGFGTGHGFNGSVAGSGKVCNFFETLEGSEPTTRLADNAQFGAILQWIKRRLHGKTTCTSTLLKVFKDDEATVLTKQTVSDDGTTQTTDVALNGP